MCPLVFSRNLVGGGLIFFVFVNLKKEFPQNFLNTISSSKFRLRLVEYYSSQVSFSREGHFADQIVRNFVTSKNEAQLHLFELFRHLIILKLKAGTFQVKINIFLLIQHL